MGKKIVLGCVGVFAIIFMCGNGLAANVSIDVNCTMKPGGSEEASIKKFKEIVEKNSGGRISVKVFMSGQLGKEMASAVSAYLDSLNLTGDSDRDGGYDVDDVDRLVSEIAATGESARATPSAAPRRPHGRPRGGPVGEASSPSCPTRSR